ncbi:hypothetical protein E4T52_09513 [Aureobasidium sp. EXF-3400]|nr:hypothetical protein E4T52_09513 [Aureobasidium sp. EXF-3400]
MSDPSIYTVGWICALPTEVTAARQFLDERHERADHVASNNDGTYTLGTMAGHNVVIAMLPDAEYGLSSAAAAVKDMLNSFPAIRIGLLVGIGGGAPSSKNDIRLGDIVVSSAQPGVSSVFQYDFGKTIQERSFQQTGFLGLPSTVVRTAVTALRSEYEEGHDIEKQIAAALQGKPMLRNKYSRPPQDSDFLYKSNVVHPDGEGDCDKLCGNQPSDIIERHKRGADELNLAVHYGIIASANQLMKDATIRDTLAKEKGIMCFEMEAAGIMNRFPVLVVRGICDYADLHNKRWQGYAAMAAAAYGKDLLRRMVPKKVEVETPLAEVIKSIHENVEGLQAQKQATQIVKWLRASDPSANHNKALQQRHENTGMWFVSGPLFEQWKAQRKAFLWLHGLAGCGKTILSAAIIDDLERHTRQNHWTSPALLYFYFDFNDTSKQALDDMLRSLIIQLHQQRPDIRQDLKAIWSSHSNGDRQPSTASLDTLLKTILRKDDSVSIVLDALDKSKTRDKILDWLESVATDETLPCRILVTARKEPEIELAFESWTRLGDRMAISPSDVNDDIGAYVKDKVRNGKDLERWRKFPHAQREIETALMEKADGMFRWVACQIDALRECYDLRELRQALITLPETLNETYSRILENIPENKVRAATTILRLLTWGFRPFRLEEVVDAVATNPYEEPCFLEELRMPVPQDILRICPSLVTLVKTRVALSNYNGWSGHAREQGHNVQEFAEKWWLRLAHFSVKEYLVSNRTEGRWSLYMEKTKSRAFLGNLCSAYLTNVRSDLTLRETRRRFPFSQYSARNWLRYVTEAEDADKRLWGSLSSFIQEAGPLGLSLRLHDLETQYRGDFPGRVLLRLDHPEKRPARCKYSRSTDPLYYASLGGASEWADNLINKGADVNIQGGCYGSTLQAASLGGHSGIVQMLLDNGADINAQSGRYGSALVAATSSGHDKIVQMLLDHGADVNARSTGEGDSALHIASFSGYEKIVQMLLDKGAEVNAQSLFEGSVLHSASCSGNSKAVQALLHKGADVNAVDWNGDSPLQHAVLMGYIDVVKVLLDSCADVNGSRGQSPLHTAAQTRHTEVLRMLLARGASATARDRSGNTPLHMAAKCGHDQNARLLLNSGADVAEEDGHGCTALSIAAKKGHTEMVKMLLDVGADWSSTSEDSLTPLDVAASQGHFDVTKLLSQGVTDCSAANSSGWTPLHSAAARGHVDVVIVLLQTGADMSITNDKGQTPLYLASTAGHVDVVAVLLQARADMSFTDQEGWNSLTIANSNRKAEIAKLRLEEADRHRLDDTDDDA